MVTAERVVSVDPNRPWLGTTREPVSHWHEKPHWRFDGATYSRRRDYPALDGEQLRRIEEQIRVRPEVEHCALVHLHDPSLGCLRPILLVQPRSTRYIHELERFCRETLACATSSRAAEHPDAVQFWKLPLTPDGTVDRARIDRAERARLAQQQQS